MDFNNGFLFNWGALTGAQNNNTPVYFPVAYSIFYHGLVTQLNSAGYTGFHKTSLTQCYVSVTGGNNPRNWLAFGY